MSDLVVSYAIVSSEKIEELLIVGAMGHLLEPKAFHNCCSGQPFHMTSRGRGLTNSFRLAADSQALLVRHRFERSAR